MKKRRGSGKEWGKRFGKWPMAFGRWFFFQWECVINGMVPGLEEGRGGKWVFSDESHLVSLVKTNGEHVSLWLLSGGKILEGWIWPLVFGVIEKC